MEHRVPSREQIETIIQLAAETDLVDLSRRPLLLSGLPPQVVGQLPVHARPMDQLRSDVLSLAGWPGNPPLLALWLEQAIALARPHDAERLTRIARDCGLMTRAASTEPSRGFHVPEPPDDNKFMALVRWALGADPSLRWLRGAIGVFAAGGAVLAWYQDLHKAVAWFAGILAAMVALRVFAELDAGRGPIRVLTWTLTVLLAFWLCLFTSAFAFDWPATLALRLGLRSVEAPPSAAPPTAAPLSATPPSEASLSAASPTAPDTSAPSTLPPKPTPAKPREPVAVTEGTAPLRPSGTAVRDGHFWNLQIPVASLSTDCIRLIAADRAEPCNLYQRDQGGTARCSPPHNRIAAKTATWEEVSCP